MEKGRASNDPICVLKVDLRCCNACPMKIKRKLLKLSGVYSVAIDREEGWVKVSGRESLNPSTLMKTIQKYGKFAEFCFVDKINPIAANQPDNLSDNTNNQNCRPDGLESQDDSRSRSDGGKKEEKEEEKKKEKKQRKGKAKVEEDGRKNGDDPRRTPGHLPHRHGRYGHIHINEAAPPVAPPHRDRLFMRPPSQFGGAGVYGNQGFWPRMSDPTPPPVLQMPPPVLPPMPPPYSYYRPETPPVMPPAYYYQPPVGNGPGHNLFSDENIDGCVIV